MRSPQEQINKRQMRQDDLDFLLSVVGKYRHPLFGMIAFLAVLLGAEMTWPVIRGF